MSDKYQDMTAEMVRACVAVDRLIGFIGEKATRDFLDGFIGDRRTGLRNKPTQIVATVEFK